LIKNAALYLIDIRCSLC